MIHFSYTTLSAAHSKPLFNHTMSQWTKLHPSHSIKFWTDADNLSLIKLNDLNDVYSYITQPISRADFCRLLYLSLYGGIYSDLDFLPLVSLDQLLDEYKQAEAIVGSMKIHDDTITDKRLLNGWDHAIPNALMVS